MRRRPPARVLVVLVAALLVGVVLLSGLAGGERGPLPPMAGVGELSAAEVEAFDPLAYDPDEDEGFLRRGRDGLAHVLYAKSPGGAEATAFRVDRLRDPVEAAADRHGVEADTLEALVFLESAGRPDVIAGPDPEGAAGLGQILPGTAVDLLGMSVDLEASKRLTRQIERERRRAGRARTVHGRRAAERRVLALTARRRTVDDRFEPARALAGAARYLRIAQDRFGREDLAATSYHMGIGNLESVIAAYVAPRPLRPTARATVEDYEISYPRLFFDSSPVRNPRTHRRLWGLGDDSRTYLFRLEAAREIMRLHREDRDELRRLARLQTAKASAEEVLRPREDNEPYGDGDALESAYEDQELVALPHRPRQLGYGVDGGMGSLAPRLKREPALYRGLRPEALATLLFIAKEVRRIGGRGTLNVTSTVRDVPYQRLLIGINPEATQSYSLHTVGYAIDIERGFRSRRQERALVHVLERLRALSVIDWVYEPRAIHLTVGPDGERYLPLYATLVAAAD